MNFIRIAFYVVHVAFMILTAASKCWANPDSEQKVEQKKDSTKQVDREDRNALERHQPIYFIYGDPLSKLQLSFKSPIIQDLPLYFGYNQIMFWALNEDSKPFRDMTYNPELFYRWLIQKNGWVKSIDIGLYGHTSNGKKGEDSRSMDQQYLGVNFERAGHRWHTRFSTFISYYHSFESTNKNIQDYMGPLAFSISFVQLFDSWIDKNELSFMAQPGGKFADQWDKGGYRIAWAFRLGGLKLVPAFYMQFYYGYAETLLNYDKFENEFRVGFIF